MIALLKSNKTLRQEVEQLKVKLFATELPTVKDCLTVQKDK
jgi:hypothetical protein